MASVEASTHETTPPTSEPTSDVSEDAYDPSMDDIIYDPSKNEKVIKAAKRGDLITLKNILELNPNFVKTVFDYEFRRFDFEDCTLLHISAVHGHVNILEYLLSIDADIHAVDDGGMTVLHAAAVGGEVKVIKYLLEKGLYINQVDNEGTTLLHFAALSGKLEIIKYLLEKGLDINQVDDDGTTVLHTAVLSCGLETVKYLLEKGLDINQVTNDGTTVLHNAVLGGKLETVKYLLEKGLDINQVTNNGDTPLHSASEEGNLKAIKFLTASGADIHITNKKGETPLLKAVNEKEGSVVRHLINECKMDITQLDQKTQSKINEILQEEGKNSSTEDDSDDMVDVQNGIQPVVRTTYGNTAAASFMERNLQLAACSIYGPEVTQHTPLANLTAATTTSSTRNESPDHPTLDQDLSVNFKAALDYLRNHYTELIHLMICEVVIQHLYQEKVITLNQKKAIQRKETEKRMEFLLDEVIIPSLEAKTSQKFISLTEVMKKSDDVSLNTTASELVHNLLD